MKIILLLSLLVLCASQNYACLDSSILDDDKVCTYMELQTRNIYTRPCPIGETCGDLADPSNPTHIYCKSLGLLKFHGDSCNINADCYSDKCVSNKCVAKEDNENCSEDYECGKHSFCMNGNCTKYATKDEICSDDLQCAFGYICANTDDGTMKCLEQYSVRAGSKADNKNLCESGFSQDGKCYETKMKSGIEFPLCIGGSECATDLIDGNGDVVGKNFTKCDVLSRDGPHCFPSSQSTQWKNYVKTFKEVRDSIDQYKVHQSFLINSPEDPSISYNAKLRKAKLDIYTYDVDDCVIETLCVLAVDEGGSGFIKVSFALVTLLFFTIFA